MQLDCRFMAADMGGPEDATGRVWGWSGHFCELDEAYQNQIIGRHIYGA